MKLRSLLKSISKNYKKINVEGICFDSRKTKKNDAFFAIKGNNKSGINFIEDAIFKGASAVIAEQKKIKDIKIPFIKVPNVRKSLSEACSNFYKKKTLNHCSGYRNEWKIFRSGFFLSNIKSK